MPYVRILGFVTLFLALMGGIASPGAAGITPPDQAFQFRAEWTDKGGVRVGWSIAPGHYLYRDRITASVAGRPVRIETEPGEPKDDPNFGPTEVYHASTMATVAPELLPNKGKPDRDLSGVCRECDLLPADLQGHRSVLVTCQRRSGGDGGGFSWPGLG